MGSSPIWSTMDINKTRELWLSIFEEERKAIENQPELSESEWKEFRESHKVK